MNPLTVFAMLSNQLGQYIRFLFKSCDADDRASVPRSSWIRRTVICRIDGGSDTKFMKVWVLPWSSSSCPFGQISSCHRKLCSLNVGLKNFTPGFAAFIFWMRDGSDTFHEYVELDAVMAATQKSFTFAKKEAVVELAQHHSRFWQFSVLPYSPKISCSFSSISKSSFRGVWKECSVDYWDHTVHPLIASASGLREIQPILSHPSDFKITWKL